MIIEAQQVCKPVEQIRFIVVRHERHRDQIECIKFLLEELMGFDESVALIFFFKNPSNPHIAFAVLSIAACASRGHLDLQATTSMATAILQQVLPTH